MRVSKRDSARQVLEALLDPGSFANWDMLDPGSFAGGMRDLRSLAGEGLADPGSLAGGDTLGLGSLAGGGLADPGSFVGGDTPSEGDPTRPGYAAELRAARTATGLVESVIAGEGSLRGRRIAVVASEFAFLGGSIGVATAALITSAVRQATVRRLPLLVLPASGGTRMQEGTLAFVRMAGISAAVASHRAAGLPYLVWLRHPTSGGVLASWASLGHVTFAEPIAFVGLLGPRVGEALHGVALPPDVQTAENLYRHGIVDGVVPRRDLAEAMVRVLAVLADAVPEQTRAPDDHRGDDATVVQVNPVTDQTRTELGVAPPGGPLEITPGRALPPSTDDGAAGSAWDSIARTRRADRPGVREVLARAATDVTVLGPGTSGLLLVLARFEGRSVIVLGQDRGASGPIGPAAFASVHRGLLLAGELGLPVVTMIDTGGAALTQGSEEGGLAGEIARCIAAMMCTTVPTVSVILGQGCGAPALALLPADRTLAAQHAWVAPLSPEGASAILYRCTDRAPELAEAQGIRAIDLLREAIVDTLVPELPDAADEPEPFCARIGHFIAAELATLDGQDTGQRLARRIARYSG